MFYVKLVFIFSFLWFVHGQNEVHKFVFSETDESIENTELRNVIQSELQNEILDLCERERRNIVEVQQMLQLLKNKYLKQFQDLYQNLTLVEADIEIDCNITRNELWENCREDFNQLCSGETEYLNRKSNGRKSYNVPDTSVGFPPAGFGMFLSPRFQKLWNKLKRQSLGYTQFFDNNLRKLSRLQQKLEILLSRREERNNQTNQIDNNGPSLANRTNWFQRFLARQDLHLRRKKRQSSSYRTYSSSWINYNPFNGSQTTLNKFFATLNDNSVARNFTNKTHWLEYMRNRTNAQQMLGSPIMLQPIGETEGNGSLERNTFPEVPPLFFPSQQRRPLPVEETTVFSATVTDGSGTHHFTSKQDYHDYLRNNGWQQSAMRIKNTRRHRIHGWPYFIPFSETMGQSQSSYSQQQQTMYPAFPSFPAIPSFPLNPLPTPPTYKPPQVQPIPDPPVAPVQVQPAPIFQPWRDVTRKERNRNKFFPTYFYPPVLPDQILPNPVLPDPVLPDPVLPNPVLPDPVLPEYQHVYSSFHAQPIRYQFPSFTAFPTLPNKPYWMSRMGRRHRRASSLIDKCLDILWRTRTCNRYIHQDCTAVRENMQNYKKKLFLLLRLDTTLKKIENAMIGIKSQFNWINRVNVDVPVVELTYLALQPGRYAASFRLFGDRIYPQETDQFSSLLTDVGSDAFNLYKYSI
nr:uncharacterized protein LOC100187493 isoform X2 [Ciona intestinalis]|eukprot:XP_009859547.1 uncharacterized protein LOC100187493 isoform X2 [Ciona intestinalis]